MSKPNQNINFIRKQISEKIKSQPYFAYENTIKHSVNDMDHFPYNRYYRGEYWRTKPVIFEREAGYRERHDICYKPMFKSIPSKKPRHCFEAPCSIVYPCYPDYLRKYADKEELEIMLNKVCVIKSP